MLTLTNLFLATFFLAYSNGANDNFKGIATLFGSGTTDYRKAIWWATITTAAGCICSIFLAETLIKNFSGRGLVPETLVNSPPLGFACFHHARIRRFTLRDRSNYTRSKLSSDLGDLDVLVVNLADCRNPERHRLQGPGVT
jgi:hypothetical protein